MIRRDFLRRLFAAAATLVSSTAFTRRGPGPSGDDIFRDRAAAQAIGRAYLASKPDLDLHTLIRDAGLCDCRPGLSVRARVHARNVADFGAGDTVLVNGWLLSRSEASACALTVHPSAD